MKKTLMKFLKFQSLIVINICLLFCLITPVFAAGATVSASASSVYVGDTVTFTVSVSDAAGYINVSGAASDYVWLENSSQSYSVTATSAGTITLNISGVVANMSTAEDMDVNGSASVTVLERPSGGNEQPTTPPANEPNTPQTQEPSTTPTAPTTPKAEEPAVKKSSNANLASLTISKGTLTPEFDAGKTDYSVSLEKDITSVTVNATVADEKANVSGTGELTVKPGKNELVISVTAEDGTVKKYVIVATVDETPDVFVQFNNKKLGVVKVVDDVQPPTSFEETTITLEGKEVKAYKSNLLKLTIVYMIDEANEKNWYLYDDTSKTVTSIYKPLAILGRNVAIIDVPEELQTRTGMKFGEVEVDKQKMMGWTFEDAAFENYVLVYLMNDQGKTQYYLYEKSENTLQLYSNQAAMTQDGLEKLQQEHEDALSQRMIMIVALVITNVLTVLLLLIVFLKKKKVNKVHIEAKSTRPVQMEPELVKEKDEIIPFDAWKYEDEIPNTESQDQESLHMEPLEQTEELFHEEHESQE